MTEPLHSARRGSSATALRDPAGARPGAPGAQTPEYAPRHLRVVEPRRLTVAQRRRRPRVLLAGVVGLVIAVGFGLVYAHVVMAQTQFKLDNLSAQASAEQATYDRLRLQVAQLESPQRIISTAEGTLGMRQPPSVTYLTPTATSSASTHGASTHGAGSVSQDGAVSSQASRSGGSSVTAPAGDADWPWIKSQLADGP